MNIAGCRLGIRAIGIAAGVLALSTLVVPPAVAEQSPARNADPGMDEHSMLPLCEAILAGEDSVEEALARHPLVGKMSRGMAPQVTFTPEEFAAAALAETPDGRFSFDRLRRNQSFVQPFGRHLETHRDTLILESVERACEFLPATLQPSEVTLNLVCGSPWDAFVLIFDGPEIFFDLGFYADAEVEQALPGFQAILVHELWHQAFLRHQEVHWEEDYHRHEDPAALFLYRMVNEGIGHYYSLHPRLYPTPAYDDLDQRAAAVFELLGENYPRYLAEQDLDARREILWSSHAGVPFWEKWGAVPGALAVYHLESEMGEDGIRDLLAHEPFSLLLAYAERAGLRPDWPDLPPQLVTDARRALEQANRDQGRLRPGEASPSEGGQGDAAAVPTTADVDIELVATERLRRGKKSGLRGALGVTLTNRGTQPVRLEELEVHALVYRDVDSDEQFVVVHPCQCLGQLEGGLPVRVVDLSPGESHTVELDDFGCGGSSWRPPPPGTYELTYRAHLADSPGALGSREPMSVSGPDAAVHCRELFASESFWEGALRSNAVDVVLRGRP